MLRLFEDRYREQEVGKNSLLGQFWLSDLAVLSSLALLKLLIHCLTNGKYGYFCDELYFLACSEHLDWGYADHAPLIALVTKTARWLLGDSLFALRFFPAVAGALLVWLTGLIVRELGGGRFAQILAALAVIIAPIFLAFNLLLTMNAFEPLFWTLGAYLVILIIKRGDQRLWLLFGIVAGVGLMNKHSMLFFGFAVVVGLLLTSHRRFLLDQWIWLGGLIALAIFLPNLLWEIKRGWPTLELLENATKYQHYPVSAIEFLYEQILLTHPLVSLIWIAGLYYYLISPGGKPYRVLGWAYLIIVSLFIMLNGKIYYPAPVYPMLLAGGSVVIEGLISKHRWNWVKPALISILIIGGMVGAPYVIPILPIEVFSRYERLLGIYETKVEQGQAGEVPQLYAYMFGWENLTEKVSQVYHRLSPEEQAKCAIWASDYGQAGAIDFFGRGYHLPKAICGNQNYYLWGPRDYSGELMIIIGFSVEEVRPIFTSIEQAGLIKCEYCWPDQDNLPIVIGRGLKMPLKEFWPRVKCYTCDVPPFAQH